MIGRIVFILFLVIPLLATNPEAAFGTYQSKQPKVPISFTIGMDGITDFKAFGRSYRREAISFSTLGRHGSSELVELSYRDPRGNTAAIHMLIAIFNDEVKMATGYFVNLAPIREDNSQGVKRIAAVEFKFRPVSCPQ